MRFEELLRAAAGEPVFDTSLLLAGDVEPRDVRRQLSRWVRAGKVLQLRRGVYALAPPFAAAKAHPFVVANRIVRPSYVSLESALAFHELIPEYVPVVTSVTVARPGRFETPLGQFAYRHVKTQLFWGLRRARLAGGQEALVATPEKALLDLLYLRPGSDAPAFLSELRLQNLERLDLAELARQAERTGSAKLRRAAAFIGEIATAEVKELETL